MNQSKAPLVAIIIVMSFAVGYLYGKVTIYEQVGITKSAVGSVPSVAQAATQPSAQPTTKTLQAPPSVTIDQVKALFADKKNLVFGKTDSKLLFVEFADPSCPYCHIAAGKNGELNKQVGDRFKLVADGGTYVAPVIEMKKLVDQGKAAFVWIFSPGHGNGELATQALYCAQEQQKFWPVHDLLMSSAGYSLVNETVQNDKAKIPQLAAFLKSVVDEPALQTCLESGKYAGRIQSDQTIARQFGANGTPSFFVNDKNYSGAYSFTDMQSTVNSALN